LRAETRSAEKAFKVCLLIVDANLNYEVKFEYEDPEKWAMTKMNGGSGVPVGITDADLATLAISDAPKGKGPSSWYKFW